MKKLILSFMLMSSFSVVAEVVQEFDENVEKKCHMEMKALGCIKGEQENQKCAELNKKKLSADCRVLLEAKKQK